MWKGIQKASLFVTLVGVLGNGLILALGFFTSLATTEDVKARDRKVLSDAKAHADSNYKANRQLLLEMRETLKTIDDRTWRINERLGNQ